MKKTTTLLLIIVLILQMFTGWQDMSSFSLKLNNEFIQNSNEGSFSSLNTRSSNWSFQAVDQQGSVGSYNSLALDSKEHPHISYYDITNGMNDLKYAHHDGNQWIIETVDSQGDVGRYSSIALDNHNNPRISYYEMISGTDGDLKYAHYDGNQWHNETVDSSNNVGHWTSLALDANNRPHISYCDITMNDLKFAYYDGNQWQKETVDSGGGMGKFTSIVLDSNDHPHISYFHDGTAGDDDLQYAYYDGNQWNKETVDSGAGCGKFTSLTLDSNAHPHISYGGVSDVLRYAYYDGNQWHKETVDTQAGSSVSGRGTSLELNSSDRPHIFWCKGLSSSDYIMKYTYYDGNQWQKENVANVGSVHMSFKIDSYDCPHVSYYVVDNNVYDLIYAFVDFGKPKLDVDNSAENGTTGDEFNLNISAKDNIKVDNIYVNWIHGGLSGNKSLVFNNGYWFAPIILDDSINNMTYTIYINDPSYNYNISSMQNVPVSDNDKPDISMDNSATVGTTGDEFALNISATDNIGVDTIYVAWSHGGLGDNESLTLVDSYWVASISLDHNTSALTYRTYVNDTSNNFNISGLKNVAITDNDLPQLGTQWNNTLTTGDLAAFSINITENIAVRSVMFNFTLDEVNFNWSVTNNTGTNWTITITIPAHATSINYYFWVNDTSDNRNKTGMSGMMEITDDDISIFEEDRTTGTPTTGDTFFLILNASDNIGVAEVYVNYTYDYVVYTNVSMNLIGEFYNRTITIADDATFVNYRFHIFDEVGNKLEVIRPQIIVEDNDKPVFDTDYSVVTPTTGDSFTIMMNASDNIGVDGVHVWYMFDDGIPHNESMTYDNDNKWNRTISIPATATILAYRFYIADAAGNLLNVTRPGRNILDDDRPSIPTHIPGTPKTGEYYNFSITLTDNICVVSANVTYSFNDGSNLTNGLAFNSEKQWNVSILVPVNATCFNYSLSIDDAEGNQIVTPVFRSLVEDVIAPHANAGGDKEIQQHHNMTFNGSLCDDNIGITNYTWTFTYDGIEKLLYGKVVIFLFDISGNYSIELKVMDETGNFNNDTVDVTVVPNHVGDDDTDDDVEDDDVEDDDTTGDDIGNDDVENDDIEEDNTNTEDGKGSRKSNPISVIIVAAVLVLVLVIIGLIVIQKRKKKGSQKEDDYDEQKAKESKDERTGENNKTAEEVRAISHDTVTPNLSEQVPYQQPVTETSPPTDELPEPIPPVEEEPEEEYDGVQCEDEPPVDELPPLDDIFGVTETPIEEPIDTAPPQEEYTEPVVPVPPPAEEKVITTYKDFIAETPPEPISSTVMRMIPNYNITHKLGAGGFGTVYKAMHISGKYVAIKLPKMLAETIDMNVLTKFQEEAEIWRKLNHTNIVEFIEGEIRPVPYLAIELMEGGNLKQLVSKYQLNIGEAVFIMAQILDGMSFAHRMATVHRDLKPENILFTKDGTPKISDWGIGKFMGSMSADKTMGMKGTMLYSAPEQISKAKFGQVDWATDIFQLGIVFYEMITREHPFYDEDPVGIIAKITGEDPIPPSEINPLIPKELDNIIMTALQKDKANRWRSADIMHHELKRLIEG